MKQTILLLGFFLLQFQLFAGDDFAITITLNSTGTTCQKNNGTITVIATGGIAPYSYSRNGNPSQASNLFLYLGAGLHTITVTDAIGETATASVTLVNQFSPPTGLSALATNPTGCATGDASITLTGLGGTPPYLYSIDRANFQVSNTWTNMNAGSYWTAVQDVNGCRSPYIFATTNIPEVCTIRQNGTNQSAICFPFRSYLALINVSGGTPPYQYSLDGFTFQTNPLFFPLPEGVHTVTVRDAAGLLMKYSVALYDRCGQSFIVSGTTVPAQCGQNGQITVSAMDGTAPYVYSIDGTTFQLSNQFTGLVPGEYTVTVRDANNLLSQKFFIVTDGCLSVIATPTSSNCGRANGSLQAQGGSGVAPYQYSLGTGPYTTNNQFINLLAGVYTINVIDASGASGSTTVTISDIAGPLINSTSVTPTSCVAATGAITVTAVGGTAPFQFSKDGINFQTSPVFSAIAAGTYTITVKDANGCTATSSVVTVVTTAGPVISTVASTSASCLAADGTITISASGGTAPYQFSTNGTNFQTSNVLSGLSAGSFTVTIKDANGCTATGAATVALTNNLTVNAGSNVTICEGGTITLAASSNGTAYSWSPATGLNNPALLNPVASPVNTTTYLLTATAGACTAQSSVTVSVRAAPVANAGAAVSICAGQNAQLNGSGGSGYRWSPASFLTDATLPNPQVINPTSGIHIYSLTVQDNFGCSSLLPSMVRVTVASVAVSAGRDTVVQTGQPLQLQVLDISGTGFTNYTWSPSFGLSNPNSPNPVATLNADMVYTLTATSAAGCTASDQISILVFKDITIYVPSGFTPNNDGRNDLLKAIPVGISHFKSFSIYDRAGVLMFRTSTPSIGWNGNYQGLPQSGVFVWMAEGTGFDGSHVFRKGTVAVIR